jgi:hypothetical protein
MARGVGMSNDELVTPVDPDAFARREADPDHVERLRRSISDQGQQ